MTKSKQDILTEIRQDVIGVLQGNGKTSQFIKLQVMEEYFTKVIEEIWCKGKIPNEYKFVDDDIYLYPLEVMYLTLCCSIEFSQTLKDENKLIEYMEFYLETYPGLEFDCDITEFYQYVRKLPVDLP